VGRVSGTWGLERSYVLDGRRQGSLDTANIKTASLLVISQGNGGIRKCTEVTYLTKFILLFIGG
jgi:hypothetical protein